MTETETVTEPKAKRRWRGKRQWMKVLDLIQQNQNEQKPFTPVADIRALLNVASRTSISSYIWTIKRETGINVIGFNAPDDKRKVLGYTILPSAE